MIAEESQKLAAFTFGSFVACCTCLFFGHRVAPAYYQNANLFSKAVLSHFGILMYVTEIFCIIN